MSLCQNLSDIEKLRELNDELNNENERILFSNSRLSSDWLANLVNKIIPEEEKDETDKELISHNINMLESESDFKGEEIIKSSVLSVSSILLDKNNNQYLIFSILTDLKKKNKIYFWKKDFLSHWKLLTQIKKGSVISYQGKEWAGQWSSGITAEKFFTEVKKSDIKKKSVWASVKKDITDYKLAFLDIEGTNDRELVEIAYLVYQNNKLITKNSFFVKPDNFSSLRWVNNYQNIKLSELKNAPKIKEILPTIKKELDGAVIISHGLKSYDYHLLLEANFFEKDRNYYFFDTIAAAKEIVKEMNWEGKGSGTVESLIRKIRNQPNFIEKHRALPDAVLHKEIFDYLVKDKKEVDLLYRVH